MKQCYFLRKAHHTFPPQKYYIYPIFRTPNPKNFSVPFYLARYPFHPQNIVVVPILKSIQFIFCHDIICVQNSAYQVPAAMCTAVRPRFSMYPGFIPVFPRLKLTLLTVRRCTTTKPRMTRGKCLNEAANIFLFIYELSDHRQKSTKVNKGLPKTRIFLSCVSSSTIITSDHIEKTDSRLIGLYIRVAKRPVFPGTSCISGPVSSVPAWVFTGRKMSRIFVKPIPFWNQLYRYLMQVHQVAVRSGSSTSKFAANVRICRNQQIFFALSLQRFPSLAAVHFVNGFLSLMNSKWRADRNRASVALVRQNSKSDPSSLGMEKPIPTPHTPQRLRRLYLRAFGAPHLALSALVFMRPLFSVLIVGNPNCD